MRKDLQKLLCEQERHGSTRSYKQVRHKKTFNEAANDEEFSSGREGMKTRYVYGHGSLSKDFSENFAPLWGIIRKNAGRKWDDVYSELCEVFDMRSHVNAHILIHLFDFVERHTYVDDDGEIMVRGRYRGDTPLSQDSCEYYVHPVSGLLLKNKEYKSYNSRYAEAALRREIEELKVRRKISNELELRRRSEDGCWFICERAFNAWPKGTYRAAPYRVGGRPFYQTFYEDSTAFDVWDKKTAQYGSWYVTSYRSASKKDLKKYGLK